MFYNLAIAAWTVEPLPKLWLLLTGKWRILTIQLETILEIASEIRKLERGYS